MPLLLPPEALDHIVDFLHDDQKALFSCSLASPLLAPAARHHLFSEVALASSEINAFLELLDVPWCTIPSAVQTLTVGTQKCTRNEGEEQEFYVPDSLPRMVERLKDVRALRFRNVNLSSISPPFLHILYQANKVEELEVANVEIYVLEPLLGYISSLPHLKALSISSLRSELTSVGERQRALSKFRLAHLDPSSSSVEVLPWLQAQSFVPIVDVFEINLGAGAAEIALITRYAAYIGSSVEEIFVKWPIDQTTPASVAYSLFPNMKSMHLQVNLRLGYTSDLILAERGIRAVAENIDSPYFTTITLEVVLLPVSFALNFLGILEHTAFQAFKWQGILDFLKERDIKDFVLIIRGLIQCQRVPVEQFLKASPFASLHKAGQIRVQCN